jgi:competence protein ComGC
MELARAAHSSASFAEAQICVLAMNSSLVMSFILLVLLLLLLVVVVLVLVLVEERREMKKVCGRRGKRKAIIIFFFRVERLEKEVAKVHCSDELETKLFRESEGEADESFRQVPTLRRPS